MASKRKMSEKGGGGGGRGGGEGKRMSARAAGAASHGDDRSGEHEKKAKTAWYNYCVAVLGSRCLTSAGSCVLLQRMS